MSSRDGHEVLIDELGPGNVFGWSAVLDDQMFKAAVWAIEDATIIVIDGDKLRRLFEANNHIGYRVVRMIAGITADRLEKLRARLVDQPFSRQYLVPPRTAGVVSDEREERDALHGLSGMLHGQPSLRRRERDRAVPVQELRDGLLLPGGMRDRAGHAQFRCGIGPVPRWMRIGLLLRPRPSSGGTQESESSLQDLRRKTPYAASSSGVMLSEKVVLSTISTANMCTSSGRGTWAPICLPSSSAVVKFASCTLVRFIVSRNDSPGHLVPGAGRSAPPRMESNTISRS